MGKAMVHVMRSKVIHHWHHRVVDGNGWGWTEGEGEESVFTIEDSCC